MRILYDTVARNTGHTFKGRDNMIEVEVEQIFNMKNKNEKAFIESLTTQPVKIPKELTGECTYKNFIEYVALV